MELKLFITHQLKEIKVEYLDSISELDDDIIRKYSPKNHWPIAWIILHCLEIYDKWLYQNLTGEYFLNHDDIIN